MTKSVCKILLLFFLLIPVVCLSQDNAEIDTLDIMDEELDEGFNEELDEKDAEFRKRMEELYVRHGNYIGEIVSYQSLFYNGRLYNARIEKKKARILNNIIKSVTISEYKWTEGYEEDLWHKKTTEYYNEVGNITKIKLKKRDRKGRIEESSEDFMYKFKTNEIGNVIKKIITKNDTFYEQKEIGIDSVCRIYHIKEQYHDRHRDSYFFDHDKNLTRSVTLGGKYNYYYEYEYDKQNNLSKFTTRDKDHHVYTTEKYKNNEWGQVLKKRVLDFNYNPIIKSRYKYNRDGYLLSERRWWISGKTKLKGTIKYEYDYLFNVITKTDNISNKLVKQKDDEMTSYYIVEVREEQIKKVPATITTYEYNESNIVSKTLVDQYNAKRSFVYEYEFYPPPEPIEEELPLEEMEEE